MGVDLFHGAAALSWYLHLREIILSYESRNNRDPTLRNLQGPRRRGGWGGEITIIDGTMQGLQSTYEDPYAPG